MPVVPVGICAISYTMFSLRDCTYGSENALPWNFLNPWTVFLQFVTTCLIREKKNNSVFNWCTTTNCANCQFMTWQIDLCWCSFCVESYSCSVHCVMKPPPRMVSWAKPVPSTPRLLMKTYLAFCSCTNWSIPGSKRNTCSKNRKHNSPLSSTTITSQWCS